MMITLVGSAPVVECAIFIVAETGTSGCYEVIEKESSPSLGHWEASLKKGNRGEPSYKESSLTAPSYKRYYYCKYCK